MKEFILELFLAIKGIGAASGLIYSDPHIYLIADNSNFIYAYHLENKNLQKQPMINDAAQENIKKSEKHDFEALAFDGNDYFLFGSGSTAKRNVIVKYNLETKKSEQINFTSIYQDLREKSDINQDNFNIEGACFVDNECWLFNRGNGNKYQNAIFRLNAKNQFVDFHPINLPKIQNVQSGFTDAIKVDDKIYFLAAAEDAASNYHDGEVKGSLIGRMDIATKQIEYTQIISKDQKFEGITLYKNTEDNVQFLLCEDADSENDESKVFKLVIDK